MKRLKVLSIALISLGAISIVSAIFSNMLYRSAIAGTINPECARCITFSEDYSKATAYSVALAMVFIFGGMFTLKINGKRQETATNQPATTK